MLKIITFFFSSLSFNNVSLSTNLTTVGSPKEAKRDGLISWLVKDKCIHPVIIVFFLHTECKYNSYTKGEKYCNVFFYSVHVFQYTVL